jgi:hypothetical protein
VRNAIKQDVLYFALPEIVIFFGGLVVSSMDGWDGLPETIRDIIKNPQSLSELASRLRQRLADGKLLGKPQTRSAVGG